jgi:hypothetical protein
MCCCNHHAFGLCFSANLLLCHATQVCMEAYGIAPEVVVSLDGYGCIKPSVTTATDAMF